MAEELSVIGKRLPRYGAEELVTGKAMYSQDVYLPRMLWGTMLLSPHAHADIVSIDTSEAEALPGVKAVLTYKDVEKFPDAYPAEVALKVLDRTVYYVGDYVAAVAAETREIAEAAIGLIKVEYNELPAVFDAKESMKPGAPVQKAQWPQNIYRSRANGRPSLIVTKTRLTGGNMEKGFAEADEIVEEEFHTQIGLHACLETDALVADWGADGMLTLWTKENPDRMIAEVGRVVMPVFGLTFNKMRGINHWSGGRFGHHVDIRVLTMAIVLAKKTGRPVKFQNLREDEYRWARTKTDNLVKIGAKKDGTLTAVSLKTIGNLGISHRIPKELWNMARAPNWTWKCPNTYYEVYGIFTNIVGTGAFRGFGSTQGHYAISQGCDRLIEKLGVDPIDFYMKNHAGKGDWWAEEDEINKGEGEKQTASGLDECIIKAVEASGWKKKWHKPGVRTLPDGRKHGIGMAICIHSGGGKGNQAGAWVRMDRDGSVQLYSAGDEGGQGVYTIEAAVCAEELGVRYQDVRLVHADTESAPYGGASAGSNNTVTSGIAVRNAARDAKNKLLALGARELKCKPEELNSKDGWVYIKANPTKRIAIRALASKYIRSGTIARGEVIGCLVDGYGVYQPWHIPWVPGQSEQFLVPKTWVCHIVELAVDTDTGEVEILNYIIAQDVGRAINLNTAENQMYGSTLMGIGYGLMEDLVLDPNNGQALNPTYLEYKIPTQLETPPTTTIFVEPIDPNTVFGAKGMGEGSLVPAAPAISHAVYNALGIRFDSTPMTPARILKALGKI